MKPAVNHLRRLLIFLVAVVAMPLWAQAPATVPGPGPQELVERTAAELARRIDGRQAVLAKDSAALAAVVNEVFLPVFDTNRAAQLVLGRHNKTATPAQRQAFQAAFYDFLLRSYARYVLRFEKNKVRILPPPRAAQKPGRAVVQTRMQLADGTQIPVDYSLYATKSGWKAFDVRIEGISYVTNYRSQFDAEISKNGLDAVIARIRADTSRLSTELPKS
jgi:phospholipid transport system substrate-binding protein